MEYFFFAIFNFLLDSKSFFVLFVIYHPQSDNIKVIGNDRKINN